MNLAFSILRRKRSDVASARKRRGRTSKPGKTSRRAQGPAAVDLKTLRCEIADGVAVLTLDRPDRLNAWTVRMESEYGWVLRTVDASPDVRAVVITGAGRGFCAGADVKALDRIRDVGDYDAAAGTSPVEATQNVHTIPMGMAKPVIAAVNGAAAGVGF